MLTRKEIQESRDLIAGCSDITLVEWSEFNKVYDMAEAHVSLIKWVGELEHFELENYGEEYHAGWGDLISELKSFIEAQ